MRRIHPSSRFWLLIKRSVIVAFWSLIVTLAVAEAPVVAQRPQNTTPTDEVFEAQIGDILEEAENETIGQRPTY